MKIPSILVLLTAAINMNAQEIYNFTESSKSSDWNIIDDVVMGGRSNGQFYVSEEGHGIFSGTVSLENNGGFSSVRYRIPATSTEGYTAFRIRLKGDGKRYQFRVRSDPGQRHAFIYEFETTGNWQEVTLPFNEMYPGFRGMKLQQPNYPGERISECSFLIANKRNESFKLEIDHIALE